MKYYILIITFLAHNFLNAQCPDMLSISSQMEIDQFLIEYPNCKNLKRLVINNVDNIDGLKQLDIVNYLMIVNTTVKDLILDSLFEVGNLLIYDNEFLENVSIFLNGGMFINSISSNNNPVLKQFTLGSFDGKVNCKFFSIENYEEATKIEVINNIDTLTIEDTYFWGNINFNNKKIRIIRQLEVFDNINYTSIQGLHKVFDLNKELDILQLGYTKSFDLLGIEYFNSLFQFSLSSIEQINNSLADSLKTLISELFIADISNIDLQFMNEAKIGFIGIYGNKYLQTLKGVNIDLSLPNGLYLGSNAVLSNINIIEDLDSLNISQSFFGSGIINITDNPNLEWCSYDVICYHIANQYDQVVIVDNKSYCEDKETLASFCLSSSDNSTFDSHIELYPNPTNGIVLWSKPVSEIEIINMDGRSLGKFNSVNNSINIFELPNGIYFARFTSEDSDKVFIKKIAKI